MRKTFRGSLFTLVGLSLSTLLGCATTSNGNGSTSFDDEPTITSDAESSSSESSKESSSKHVHTPGEPVEENRAEPTCTKKGSYDLVTYCTECYEEVSREKKTIAALGHDYVECGEREATFEADAYIIYECSRCQHQYNSPIKDTKLKHTYSEEWSVDLEKGTHYHACTDHGYETKRSNESIHSYDKWIIDHEPDVTDVGLQHRVCSVCGHIDELEYGTSQATFDKLAFVENGPDAYTVKAASTDIIGEVIIPSRYNMKPVTKIENFGFKNCKGITSVIMSDGLTYVSVNAFQGCTSLQSFTFSKNTTVIAQEAFSGCTSLKSIDLPEGTTQIIDSAFKNCRALSSVKIPSTLSYIGSTAFQNCVALKSFTATDALGSLGAFAFADSGINDTYIKFTSWDNLLKMEWNGEFRGNLHFIDEDGLEVTDFVFPEGTTKIPNQLFYKCKTIKSVTLPDGFKTIGSHAFYGCTSLSSINFPDSLTTIGGSSFYGCTSLTGTIIFPDTLTGIGSDAFKDCDSSLKFAIRYSSYENLTSMSGKQYLGNFTVIDDEGEPVTEIVIPEGTTSIKSYAFYNCYYLKTITIPDTVTSIGSYAFYNCKADIVWGDHPTVETIYSNAFNTYLGTSLVIPDTVKTIGRNAFYGCRVLKSITLPFIGNTREPKVDSDTSLFGYVFGGPSNGNFYDITQNYKPNINSTKTLPVDLKNVVITGGKLTYGAFSGCSNIESITLGDDVDVSESKTLARVFYNCSSLSTISLPDGFAPGEYCFYGCKVLRNFAVPDNADAIESYSFSGCTLLESITIPEGVTSIGSQAFYGCTKLVSVVIPEGVTSIGSEAFSGCTALKSVTLPSTLEEISGSVFYKCTALESVTIPEGIASIGYQVFYGCTSLKNVTLPDSVTSIGNKAFYGCTSIGSVVLPDEISSIGSEAFANCGSGMLLIYYGSLEHWLNVSLGSFFGYIAYYFDHSSNPTSNIVIPDGTEKINHFAFGSCSYITKVTIPKSVTSIGVYAFYNCRNITRIDYEGTGAEWKSITFGNNWAKKSSSPVAGPNFYVYCSDGNKYGY